MYEIKCVQYLLFYSIVFSIFVYCDSVCGSASYLSTWREYKKYKLFTFDLSSNFIILEFNKLKWLNMSDRRKVHLPSLLHTIWKIELHLLYIIHESLRIIRLLKNCVLNIIHSLDMPKHRTCTLYVL